VETCKLNGVDPQAYLCELLTWLVGDGRRRASMDYSWHDAASKNS
jgi:hypothetical protein